MSRWPARTTEERFRALVGVRTGDECWPWLGAATHGGYGRFYMGEGVYIGSNRAAWLLLVGPIPDGMHVLHRCDNPPCCNPAHLFLGSHSDNMADAASKGRTHGPNLAGESNPAAVLRETDVRCIRRRRQAGEVGRDLASEYGISESTVSAIVHRRLWAGVK